MYTAYRIQKEPSTHTEPQNQNQGIYVAKTHTDRTHKPRHKAT